jgi:hypothetical protein
MSAPLLVRRDLSTREEAISAGRYQLENDIQQAYWWDETAVVRCFLMMLVYDDRNTCRKTKKCTKKKKKKKKKSHTRQLSVWSMMVTALY